MEEARKTKHAREETPWSKYYKNVVKGTLHNNLPNTTFLKKKVVNRQVGDQATGLETEKGEAKVQ